MFKKIALTIVATICSLTYATEFLGKQNTNAAGNSLFWTDVVELGEYDCIHCLRTDNYYCDSGRLGINTGNCASSSFNICATEWAGKNELGKCLDSFIPFEFELSSTPQSTFEINGNKMSGYGAITKNDIKFEITYYQMNLVMDSN